MTVIFPTASRALYAEKQIARGLATQARDIKPELQRAVDSVAHGLWVLSQCRPDMDRLSKMLALFEDTVNLIDAQCRKDLENAGEHFSPVDLTECHALWNKVHP